MLTSKDDISNELHKCSFWEKGLMTHEGHKTGAAWNYMKCQQWMHVEQPLLFPYNEDAVKVQTTTDKELF